MAQAALIWKPAPTKIDSLIVDAAPVVTHDLTSTITDHPVETGANISDHSRPDPERLTLEVIVSNTPLHAGQARTKRQGEHSFSVAVDDADPKRARAAYDLLAKLRLDGTLISVVTPLRQYDDMAIEAISIPESAQFNAATGLRFSLRLKRIRIVKNKLTRTVTATDPRAQSKVKAGAQVTPGAAEADVDPLRRDIDAVKGFVGRIWP